MNLSTRKPLLIVFLVLFAISVTGISAFAKMTNKEGYIGLYVDDIDRAVRKALRFEKDGVMVDDVVKDGPADKAGIVMGDIVVSIDGVRMTSTRRLRKVVRNSDPETTVDVVVFRMGKEETVKVTLGAREDRDDHYYGWHRGGRNIVVHAPEVPDVPDVDVFMYGDHADVWLGIQMDNINKQLGKSLGVPSGRGALISEVIDDSPAMDAGLEAGDVITNIGDMEIYDTDDIHGALSKFKAGDKAKIVVVRDKKEMTIEAELEERDDDMIIDFGSGYFDGNAISKRIAKEYARAAKDIAKHSKDLINKEEFKKAQEEMKKELKKMQLELKTLGKKVDEIAK